MEWIEHSFDFKDDREAFETTDDVARAAASMFEYGTHLIAEKRAHPADDMLSIVCNAEPTSNVRSPPIRSQITPKISRLTMPKPSISESICAPRAGP